jgi:hypothetical protein
MDNGTPVAGAHSRQSKDQPRSGNIPADAGGPSIQRLAALTLLGKPIVFLVFTMASVVARLGKIPLRAVKTVRLLQAANPILATFTVPFCARPDPGEDDFIGSSVFLQLPIRT